MSTADRTGERLGPAPPLPTYLDARAVFAERYLFGEGIEIGPLHQPLAIPAQARARYVDRMPTAELRREYPELAGWKLTEIDLVEDGERLDSVPPRSQDFVVANHFLEHCEDPIGTIETHLGKLRPGGVLFYAVPDKRFTFDHRRPVTELEHLIADHEQGPERSRPQHYEEWSRLVIDSEAPDGASEEWVAAKARALDEQGYSIHMHVWTQAEFLRMVLAVRDDTDDAFDLEAAARVGLEFVVVLRKAGPQPPPPSRSATMRSRASRRLRGLRQTAAAARRKVHGWRRRP